MLDWLSCNPDSVLQLSICCRFYQVLPFPIRFSSLILLLPFQQMLRCIIKGYLPLFTNRLTESKANISKRICWYCWLRTLAVITLEAISCINLELTTPLHVDLGVPLEISPLFNIKKFFVVAPSCKLNIVQHPSMQNMPANHHQYIAGFIMTGAFATDNLWNQLVARVHIRAHCILQSFLNSTTKDGRILIANISSFYVNFINRKLSQYEPFIVRSHYSKVAQIISQNIVFYHYYKHWPSMSKIKLDFDLNT